MLRYFLTAFIVACVAFLGFAGWQGSQSSEPPLWGHKEFNNMEYQSRYRALGESGFRGFEDGREARPPVAGTAARGTRQKIGEVFSPEYTAAFARNAEFVTGKEAGGKFIDGFPKRSLAPDEELGLARYRITAETLRLGKEKFTIYCKACHGVAADGKGILKRRGEIEGESSTGPIAIASIADLHSENIRKYPNGRLFDIITNGAGAQTPSGAMPMPANADKLTPEERWAVVAYLRALQLSQNCPPALVPPGVDTANLK